MSSTWPPIAELVPHTGIARLLKQIVAFDAKRVEALGEIPAEHPLAQRGWAPTLLAIELCAQAAAAMETLIRRDSFSDAKSRTGALVRVREASFRNDLLPVDTPIHVIAQLVGSASPLAIYRIAASLNGTTVAEGVISTHSGMSGQ